MKKVADERQEMEIMKIERTGFWVLFIALAADILVKVLFFHVPVRNLIGEHIVFLGGCVTIIIGCAKRGLWTNYSVPCVKDYLLHSLGGTVIFTLLFAGAMALRDARHLAGTTLAFAAFIFLLMFGVLAAMGEYTKRKQKKLDETYGDD